MDVLAARCEISKRTIYRLFPGKKEVFAIIADEHRQELLALPFDDDSVSVDDALRHIFRIDIDDKEDFERMVMIRLVKQECHQTPEVLTAMREHARDKSIALFTEWMTRQVDKKRIDTAEPAFAAGIMLDMFIGSFFTKEGGVREWHDRGDHKAYMEGCIRIFLDGTRAK
jgi:AcrR family transcriptional regulator